MVKWAPIVGAVSTRTPASVPDRVGRYDILMPIASGGMATVYLARAVGSSGFVTEVALKLTHEHLRTSAEFANDLVEEAKLAARIRHRNVVSIIDVGDDPTGLYLVMEYIEGDTLAGLSRGSVRVPVPMGIRILVDALAGLHASHEVRDDAGDPVGLVHRDFTPQNILVGTDGVARLADFGIAKAATRHGHTRTGIVKGKIAYMAPEQAHGTPLDRRCDVWAAGVVAWELFAQRRLHGHDDDLATLLRVATERPPLLRTVVPDLPEPIEAAVARALTMEVEGRCPTAQAFAKELTAACRDTVGIAEVDEVAAWMATHVGPRLSGRRLQVARARSHRESTRVTRVDGVAASGSGSGISVALPISTTGSLQPASTAPVSRPVTGTMLTPTISTEQETRQLTDGVSVVARLKASRPGGPGTRAFALGAGAAVALVAAVGLWLAAAGRPAAQSGDTPSTSATAGVASGAGTASPAVTSAATVAAATATAGAAMTTLRLHGNAFIASVRVNDRAVPVARPGMNVSLQVAGLDTSSATAIDAFASDGRRAEVAVPAGVTDVSLDFRAPSAAPPAPVRGFAPRAAAPAVAPAAPPPTSPPAAAPTAPLAPSPY